MQKKGYEAFLFMGETFSLVNHVILKYSQGKKGSLHITFCQWYVN